MDARTVSLPVSESIKTYAFVNHELDDGKIYATDSGQYMYIQCCTDRDYGRGIGGAALQNFGQCMDLCMKEETGECRRFVYPFKATTGPNR